MTIDKIGLGVLYRVDDDDMHTHVASIHNEELLIAIEIVKEVSWTQIRWLWLTGPEAGTSFVGGKVGFNHQCAVSEVLEGSYET